MLVFMVLSCTCPSIISSWSIEEEMEAVLWAATWEGKKISIFLIARHGYKNFSIKRYNFQNSIVF